MSASSQLINLKSKPLRHSYGTSLFEGNILSSSRVREFEALVGQGSQTQILNQRNNVEAVPMGTSNNQPSTIVSSSIKTLREDNFDSEVGQQMNKGTEKLFQKNEGSKLLQMNGEKINRSIPSKYDQIPNAESQEIFNYNARKNCGLKNYQQIGSQSSSKAFFNHQSKFFTLDQQMWQAQQNLNLSQKRRRNGAHQGIISYPSSNQQQRIPDIQEWFTSLSIDDKVLCLTIVDQFLTNSVQRMQGKINKYGQGLFRLQSVIEKRERNPNQAPDDFQYTLKQDFAFTSIKPFLKQYKDQFVLQQKQIPEKELLDYIRITYTQQHTQQKESYSNTINQSSEKQQQFKLNTITVAPALVENPTKFIALIQSIVGQNFLKIPYEILWDDQNGFFKTEMPIWFDPNENNSLSTWIIFYLEISLWAHYDAYVKNGFRNGGFEDSLNKMIFISKDNQYINLKNELTTFWQSLCQDAQINNQIIKEIGQEIFQRSLKETSEKNEINQFNGGLSEFATKRDALYTDNKIMEVLLQNQEPHKFISEVCMISLSRMGDHTHLLHRIFVDILRERIKTKDEASSSAQKNKKKKNKKKQKQLQKKSQQDSQNDQAASFQTSPSIQNNLISLLQNEEHKQSSIYDHEEVKVAPSRNNEDDYNEYYQNYQEVAMEEDEEEEELKVVDFCSNQQIMQQKYKVTNTERNRTAIDEILSELLFDTHSTTNMIKTASKREVKIPQLAPVYNKISILIDHTSDEELFSNFIDIDESKDQEILLKEEIGASSGESTDDQQEIASAAQYALQVNQANISKGLQEKSNNKKSSNRLIQYQSCDEQNLKNLDEEHSPSLQSKNTDLQGNIDEKISQSSEKVYKKKGFGNQNKGKKMMIHDGTLNENNCQEELQVQVPAFQIIRSSKTFNPNQGASSTSQSGSNQVQQRKKKNKRKGNKTIGGVPVNSGNSDQQTARMNTFMRNMIAAAEDEEFEESADDSYATMSHTKQSLAFNNESASTSLKTKSLKKDSLKNDNSSSVKHIYVKKGTVPQQAIPDPREEEEKEPSFVIDFSTNTSKSQHHKESLALPTADSKKPQPSSRFDNFINSKEPGDAPSFSKQKSSAADIYNSQSQFQSTSLNLVNSSSSNSNKDKKRKSQMSNNGGGNKKKSNFWGTKSNNNNNNGKKSNNGGNQTPNDSYNRMMGIGKNKQSNNGNQQQIDMMNNNITGGMYNNNNNQMSSYISAPVSRQHSYQDGQYQHMMNLQQPDYSQYNMYPQLDDYNYLQQIIQQAIISSQQQQQHPYPYQHDDHSHHNTHYYTQQAPQDADTTPTPVEDEEYDEKSESYYELLDSQMMKMVKEIERKLDSVRKERQTAIDIIEGIVKETYYNSQHTHQHSHGTHNSNSSFVGIRMYGSMASGLAIEQSDVDLAVVGLDLKGSKELLIEEMRKLYEQIELFVKSKSSLRFIESATVPVIKLQIDLQKISKMIEKRQGGSYKNDIEESMRYLGIDITFEDVSKQQFFNLESIQRINQGIQCISYIQELCMQYPDLKPIVLVLKKVLQNHNLNQPFLGGLNSYSLVLMTSAFLNIYSEQVKSKSKNLREFLSYFGAFFDPSSIMIDDQSLIKVPQMVEPMTVIDPLNKLNNTTRSAFRIKDIQQIFKKAFKYLIDNHNEYTRNDNFQVDVITTLTEMEEPSNNF